MQTDLAFARENDPATSHEAAASIAPATLRDSQLAVFRVLAKFGPLDDQALVDAYCDETLARTVPRQSDSGIRTRRKELCRMGRVQPMGTTKTASGRSALIWAATEAAA